VVEAKHEVVPPKPKAYEAVSFTFQSKEQDNTEGMTLCSPLIDV